MKRKEPLVRPSRRLFLKTTGIAGAAGLVSFSKALASSVPINESRAPVQFSLGLTSYTFRAFTLDQTIAMTRRLGMKKLALKDFHMPLKSTDEEIRTVVGKIKEAGLELTSCGVIYMKTREEVLHAFAYAQAAGLKLFVGVPDPALLSLAEQKIKETDIAMAIHNHGPTDERYPSPESAYKLIEKMDKRIGLCIDVGHTQRLGVDPSGDVERFFDRLLDIHMKDVSSADAKGTTVEIGRGVIDIPKLLKTLQRLGYSKSLHFEHEKDEKDPLPGVA
ncbi:MAG: TIM barrel protein, partial [Bacteroidota bacterium]